MDGNNDSSCRKTRKIGEKLRRDKLNTLVAKLAEENPWSANSEKRVDKAGILKLTVSFLKLHHGLKKLKLDEKHGSSYLSSSIIQSCLQEALNGFLIVVSGKEQFVFVSSSVTKLLGLHQVDLVGADISKFVHPDDVELFKQQLTVQGTGKHIIQPNLTKANGTVYEGLNSSLDKEKSFYVRFLKELKKTPEIQYEMIHFKGHLKVNPQDGSTDVLCGHWLIAVGRPIVSEINEIQTFYSKNDEFVTQFDLHGNIWFSDHRSALVLCKLPKDSVGQSCYRDIYKEDLPVVAHAHTQIMKLDVTNTVFRIGINKHECCYLLSKSVVARDNWTNEPKYIVSLNIALSEEEGKHLLEEQRQTLKHLFVETCEDIPRGEKTEIEITSVNNQRRQIQKPLSVRSSDSTSYFSQNKTSIDLSGSENNKFKSGKRSLSSDVVIEPDIYSGITDISYTDIHDIKCQADSTSVKKSLLCRDGINLIDEGTFILGGMDTQQSRYSSHNFQSYDNLPNRNFDNRNYSEPLSQLPYKSPYSPDGRHSGPSPGNHPHGFSGFHPYHRTSSPGKMFQAPGRDFTSSPQSDISHHAQKIDRNIERQNSSTFSHLGVQSSAALSPVANKGYPSSMDMFPNYGGSVATQNYQYGMCPPIHRPMNHFIPTTSDMSYIGDNNSHKTYENYPYFGTDSLGDKQYGLSNGYGPFKGGQSHINTSVNNSHSMTTNSNNIVNESFDNFMYDSSVFGNKSASVNDYLQKDGRFQITDRKTLQSEETKYTALDLASGPDCHRSSDIISDVSGKDNLHDRKRSKTELDVPFSPMKKVQSPTVDSVTSPCTPQKTDEKELQIQFKLSQQLHCKQDLIGKNLTNQREELGMLKTQLEGQGDVSGQYLSLLQRLNNIEKEVQEQENILTDLREQSNVKIKQLMIQES